MGRLRYLRLSGRQRLAIWSALIVLVLTTVACMAIIHMEPILVSMATARVSNTVNRIVVEAVNDAIQGGEIDYGVLVEFEKDEFVKGKITTMKNGEVIFEGEINDSSVWKGKIKYVNGDVYEGEGKGDVRDGFGVYYYNNSDRSFSIGCNWENNVKKGPLVNINVGKNKLTISKRDTNTTDSFIDDNTRTSNYNTSTNNTHN